MQILLLSILIWCLELLLQLGCGERTIEVGVIATHKFFLVVKNFSLCQV